MLTQDDVVRLLSKPEPIPQHIAFSILHAWVYSKSRRGNLPSETLSKLLSLQRKIQIKLGRALPAGGPIAAALDAMKAQLLAVNRKWVSMGAQAFGQLGNIGMTGGHVDAIWAWTKATDGKIKQFPDGKNAAITYYGEMDAGRVIEARYVDTADPLAGDPLALGVSAPPPLYDGPPGEPDQEVVQALDDRLREDETGVPTNGRGPAWRDSVDEGRSSISPPPPRNHIEEGTAHLARLRQMKEEQETRGSESPAPPRGTA